MMEHVRIFDWCTSAQETHFVEEADLDNCTTEKILRNKFFDPLLSSDSDNDDPPNEINWDEIFKKTQIQKFKLFVPCLRPVPPYPRVSELTPRQHIQFLKILSDENPNVLEDLFLGKPNRQDFKAFESAKETYRKEQKAYIEWAKTLWTTDHCIRALRPKPCLETVYEAEYKVRAHRISTLPKHYDVAAQITLENQNSKCDAVLKQDLIRVTLAEMPQVQIPEKIERHFSIIRPCTVPEPCQKHPYQIVLPNEEALSFLPITEVHRELATFSLNNGAQFIASENALKCLMQWNRHWLLPLSVCETIGADGSRVNVTVLDSEFFLNKDPAPMRTYRAFRHLLEYALIPSSEREKMWQIAKSTPKKKEIASHTFDVSAKPIIQDVDMTSDDEDNNLFIDAEEDMEMTAPKSPGFESPKSSLESPKSPSFSSPKAKKIKSDKTNDSQTEGSRSSSRISHESTGCLTRAASLKTSEDCPDIGQYSCTCKGTLYEKPPRRSFRKWQFKNKGTNEKHDIIIHCPHKARDKSSELILEPIPEYQIDIGASEQTPDSLRSVALSLAIRKQAALLNVRVDGPTGDVATFERLSSEEFVRRHPDVTRQVISTVHTALSQLHGLLPGHYVLQHEPSHGSNAMLMCPRAPSSQPKLVLNLDSSQLVDADEAHLVKVPPTITTALLPYHKHRRVLPCAFTPYENQIAKEPKKPPSKKKAPPQAIKWPKRKTVKKNR